MGHFAKVVDRRVTAVIVAERDFFNTFVDSSPGDWIRTSYNTRGNVYYTPDTNTPDPDQTKRLRGNFAGVGYHYDPTVVIDGIVGVFYTPQLYNGWILSTETWTWNPPIPYPMDGNGYFWDNATENWVIPA